MNKVLRSRLCASGWVWLFAAALGGCATGPGPRDSIVFDSEPRGARVVVSGRDRGATPLTLSVDEAFPRHWTRRVHEDEQGFAFYRRLETVDVKLDGCATYTKAFLEQDLQGDVMVALKCGPQFKAAPAAAPAAPVAAPAASGTVEQRLRALDELRQKGLLNDEEYRSQRQRILGNL